MQFASDANKLPSVQQARASIRVNVPQLYVDVDRAKAKSLGVSLTDLFQTLQSLLGTLYVNDFNLYGKTYRVQVQAQEPYREQPQDIGGLYVRGTGRVDSGVVADHGAIPQRTEHRDAIQRLHVRVITASPGPGKSSGEMLAAIDQLVQSKYAALGVGAALSGESYQESTSTGGVSCFALGIIMVFLVLAAQYESWSIPFAVCSACRSASSARSSACCCAASRPTSTSRSASSRCRTRREERDPDRRVRERAARAGASPCATRRSKPAASACGRSS